MKIYVTGASGTLGKELVARGCIPLEGDITNLEEITQKVQEASPDVLIHCASITDVDYCETHFKESFNVNVRGTSNVAAALPEKALMVYLSSDHIFKGSYWLSGGYSEKHIPSPVNRYGFSKWGGELAVADAHENHLIVRTSKCYNIPWMMPTITKLQNNEVVEFTALIKRSFMYLPHFIDAMMWVAYNQDIIDGIDVLNISGESVYSYAQFWTMMRVALGLGGDIIPIRTELVGATPRPFKAGLDTHKAKKLGVPMGSMELAIRDITSQLASMSNDLKDR